MNKLYLYDSNRPDVESEFEPDWTRRIFKIKGARAEYGYYAPFDAYEALDVRSPSVFNRQPSTTGLATNPFNLPGNSL